MTSGKDRIDCNEARPKLPAFIEGTLEDSDMQAVEEHLKSCGECGEVFEASENKALMKGPEPGKYDVRKMESRLAMRITGKLLTICALVLVAGYVVLTVIPQTLLSRSLFDKQQQIQCALKDVIQFTMPGARIKHGWEGRTGIVDIINVAQFEQPLVGGGMRKGKLDLAVPIYVGENNWRVTSTNDPEGMSVGMNYPQVRSDSSVDFQWSKLGEAEKGTESQVAVYFERPVSISEMDDIVAKIDAFDRNLWFAVDTNGLELHQWGYRKSGILPAQWGFPLRMELATPTESSERKDADGKVISSVEVTKDSEGRVTSVSRSVGLDEKHPVSQVIEDYRNEMKNFVSCAKYFKDDEFSSDLGKVNALIRGDGFKIRGAILQASTSNLLKLRGDKNIARVDIMQVDFDYFRSR